MPSHADLLISGDNSPDLLPIALRTLAGIGTAPRAIKVHRWQEFEQLIELRIDELQHPAIQKVAHRLCELLATARVTFRASGGAGGWLVARHSAAKVFISTMKRFAVLRECSS
jgi:hypothetical protein